ncbi:hypothetical protein KC992_01115 [Candidatus Saccharibacteria bacterium]|nr:hypothetical protein [Candidatus Saccharibacteria bacterium]
MSRRAVLAIFLAGLWITASEFFRNEVLLKSYWTEHYQSLGIMFPSEPKNGFVWFVWSLALSGFIYMQSRKFATKDTVLLVWFSGFFMMWLVVGNMAVLPIKILLFAIPLSLFEVYLADKIIRKIIKK